MSTPTIGRTAITPVVSVGKTVSVGWSGFGSLIREATSSMKPHSISRDGLASLVEEIQARRPYKLEYLGRRTPCQGSRA